MQVSSLEKENSDLEAEGRRLKKKLDALKNMAFQLEALEKENSQLEHENLELRRSAESLRSAGAKAAQLEAENRELESERSQLKRSLELLKASSKKTERLEVTTVRQPVLPETSQILYLKDKSRFMLYFISCNGAYVNRDCLLL